MSGIFRIPNHILFLIALLLAKTVAAPLQNITLALPPGSSDHGSPGLLCVPTKWSDIVVFFLTKFGKSDLQVAARAGALCMVFRGHDWRPQQGGTIPNAVFMPEKWNRESEVPGEESREQSENTTPGMAILSVPDATGVAEAEKYVDIGVYEEPWMKSSQPPTVGFTRYARKIHGAFQLPPGYRLEFVPRRAAFIDTTSEESLNSSGTTSISCNYSSVKIFIALAQAIYSIATIYRTRGDQIREFGYAAFGLTVYTCLTSKSCRPTPLS
jgi:hypothetical protein